MDWRGETGSREARELGWAKTPVSGLWRGRVQCVAGGGGHGNVCRCSEEGLGEKRPSLPTPPPPGQMRTLKSSPFQHQQRGENPPCHLPSFFLSPLCLAQCPFKIELEHHEHHNSAEAPGDRPHTRPPARAPAGVLTGGVQLAPSSPPTPPAPYPQGCNYRQRRPGKGQLVRESQPLRCARADRSPRSAAAALPDRQTAPAAWEPRGTRRPASRQLL